MRITLVGILASPPAIDTTGRCRLTLSLEGAAVGAAFAARRGRAGRAPFGDLRPDGALDVTVTVPVVHREYFVAALGADALRGATLRATVRVRGWTVRSPGFSTTTGFAFDLIDAALADGSPLPAPPGGADEGEAADLWLGSADSKAVR